MNPPYPILANILSLADRTTWQTAIDLGDQGVTAWLSGLNRCNFSRILFIGCGTSLFNGQAGKYLCENLAGIPSEAVAAFSFASYAEPALLGAHTLVVGISTSGETQSVCDGLLRARQAGSPTLALTAHPGSPVTKSAEAVLLTGGQSDQVGVKTSSYVQALVVLSILAARLAGPSSVLKNVLEQIALAAGGAAACLAEREQIEQLAHQYAKASAVFILGSGPNLATAGESSLKVIEMAKIVSEGHELEDFFHGRLNEVDPSTPVFFITPSGPSIPRLLDFLTVTHQVGVPSIVLTDQANPAIQALASHVIQLPVVLEEYASPLLSILPVYLFAHELALQRGQDPLSRRYGIAAQKVKWGESSKAQLP
jgi:glutamine---fructose-6-phosphate transaminase (isomerizing)